MDWCRDIDYGSFPQWLALVVGAVVAGFTIFGILTARRSYIDDVRIREFSQARLIYANLFRDQIVEQDRPMVIDEKDIQGLQLIYVLTSTSEKDLVVNKTTKGLVIQPMSGVKIRVMALSVHNNSEELISGVRVSVNRSDETTGLEIGLNNQGIIGPRATATCVFICDNFDKDFKFPQVTFEDSTGQWWVRDGPRPVRKAGRS